MKIKNRESRKKKRAFRREFLKECAINLRWFQKEIRIDQRHYHLILELRPNLLKQAREFGYKFVIKYPDNKTVTI